MLLALTCLLFILCIPNRSFGAIFDLSELQWTLRNQNDSIQIPGAVPSQAHLDLLRAGIITEPLLGINDFTQRWVVTDNWTYTADLSPFVKGLSPSSEVTLLVFYGIDTVANITVAGHPVAWVNNQFRQYVYDVSRLIASPADGHLNLTVAFESADLYGLNVSARPDAEFLPGDTFEYPIARQWVRKVASDFGWDWGPAFVPGGIFKPAYLVTLPQSNSTSSTSETGTPPVSPSSSDRTDSPIFIEDFSVDIYKVGQDFSSPPVESADWVVNITLFVRSASSWSSPTLALSFPELHRSTQFTLPDIPTTVDTVTRINVDWTLPDNVAERWYPHNLGTPRLYNLSATLDLPASKGQKNSAVSFTTTTGFRTIQLVQTPYSQEDVEQRGIIPGDQWHFEINGKAFYSLGTNIIPFDPFYARTTPEQVRWVLESAKNSGQNMLRIWGGGVYQPSDTSTSGGVYDFYSICDELGILAWSELIFSDTLYPINDFYLESIEPEVRQNVRRVNRHPSNVQWAGGNEIEGIVMQANVSLPNGTHYLNEFVTLFQDFLYNIVVSETRSVPYTDCSTTHGVLSLDPYVLRFGNGTEGHIYGNSERYNYDASQAFNYSTYPVSRFVNEFGFHSMPSFYSWEEVLTSATDFAFNSTVVMSRDHHPPAGGLAFPNPNAPQGQSQMTSAVELWLPTPLTFPTNPNHTFAQWCWSTQIFQSMNMVSEIAWYRRGAGLGENNLGSLVWQLNDIWQGVSWSSIEYSGRWKVLQYGIASIYSPVVIYPFWTPTNETLEIMVTSDRWETVSGQAQMTWFDWEGKELARQESNFKVPSLNNSVVYTGKGLKEILPAGKDVEDVWMRLNLTASANGETVTNEQFFTPTSLANARLVDPKITVTNGQDLTFKLSAQGGVAPWTWIDHPAGTVGTFVDATTGILTNGFYLVPGADRTLKFVPNSALSRVSNPDPSAFVVRSLWDNTHT